MKLPRPYETFKRAHPEIWKAYDQLGALSSRAGPLDRKSTELIKLAMAIGAGMEGAVHSHTRRALEAGATRAELSHVVLLGVTTLGFPSMMAAKTWVEDELGKRPVRSRRRG
ncbi:MAG TPA: carboxymuconolactone decarboxylase family protein [candidate division Zixibacteria bacterium]|nr:carboxymuconolactone decarboxylase family protein [candidate division Zixibacteria bacterium]